MVLCGGIGMGARLVALAVALAALARAARAQGNGFGRNLYVKSYPAIPDYQSNLFEGGSSGGGGGGGGGGGAMRMQMAGGGGGGGVGGVGGGGPPPYYQDTGFGMGPAASRALKPMGFGPAAARPHGAGGGLQCAGGCKQGRAGPLGIQAVVDMHPAGESGVEGRLVLSQAAPNGPVAVLGNLTGLPVGRHGLHVHQSGDLDNDCANLGPHFIAFWGRHGGPRDQVRHVGDLGNIEAQEGEDETLVKLVDHVIQLAGPRSVAGRSLAVSKNEDDYGRANTEESALTGSSGPPLACGVIAYLN